MDVMLLIHLAHQMAGSYKVFLLRYFLKFVSESKLTKCTYTPYSTERARAHTQAVFEATLENTPVMIAISRRPKGNFKDISYLKSPDKDAR